MYVIYATAAQEALINETIVGRIAELILDSRDTEPDAPILNFLRVNRLWYDMMLPRLWRDTRACRLRPNESVDDYHLSNILNKVRSSERQRHASYIRIARLYACYFLNGGAEAYSKILSELEFPNLRSIELYITDSRQTFPLALFPEVREVVVRTTQRTGLFCVDVHMAGAIQLLWKLAEENQQRLEEEDDSEWEEEEEDESLSPSSSMSPILEPRPMAYVQAPHWPHGFPVEP
ncbi:hypothetical protein KEM56_001661 [Ascosphaera pollenicola]|nr:hypothetical protein KEM56_001661 [Ascosphaera pollenicola]